MKYQGFVFDLDGTLVNSLSDICSTVNRLREEYNTKTLPDSQIAPYIGTGLVNLLGKVMRDVPEGPSIEEMANRYRVLYEERPMAGQPYEGAQETLRALNEVSGIALGVCTNRGTEIAKKLLKKNFPEVTFFAVLGSDAVAHPKPSGDHLLQTLIEMGVAPENACYVGDHLVDQQAAKEARVDFFAASYGFGGVEAGPEQSLVKFSDILEKTK